MSINKIIAHSYSLPKGLHYRVPSREIKPSITLTKAWLKLGIDPAKPYYTSDQAHSMTYDPLDYNDFSLGPSILWKVIFLIGSLGLGFSPLIYAIEIDSNDISPILSSATYLGPAFGIIAAFICLLAILNDDSLNYTSRRHKPNHSRLSAAEKASIHNFRMRFYRPERFTGKFFRIAYAAVYTCKGIYENRLWSNPDYELGIPQTDLQEVLRNILFRIDIAQEMYYRNESMRDNLPRHTYTNFSVVIDDSLESICKEIEELQKYCKNLEKMEREYRKIERLPDAIKLNDDIRDAMASSESNYALQSFRYETPMLSETIGTLKKIAEEMYDSTLVFDPKAALKGRE